MPTSHQHLQRLWFAIPALLLGQGVLAVLVRTWPALHALDSRISSALAISPDSSFHSLVDGLTQLGSGRVVVPVLLMTVLVLWIKGYRKFAQSGVAGFLAARIITDGLKRLVARPRPALHELGYTPSGWDTLSFPSGHTSSACYLYGFLLLVGIGFVRNPQYRVLITSAVILLVMTVGMSRVLLGEHFPSDVVGGLLSGSIGLLVARMIADSRERG